MVASQPGESTGVLPDAPNIIDGKPRAGSSGMGERRSPATGLPIGTFALSDARDVTDAVSGARAAQREWAARTVVDRGLVLRRFTQALEAHADELVDLVVSETGKPRRDAAGELGGAVEMGYFVAGEGRRFYGRTTTSGVPHKSVSLVRSPIGVAALIAAANTPLPNYAWKVFPALLCGNSAVLKPSEHTPLSATRFVEIAHEAGVPAGVLQLVHGHGDVAGAALADADVDVLSFTGSAAVGRRIAAATGSRLVKTCLELGGKNPLVVCDDADLDRAAAAAVLSAFSNAGQRCAAGSRFIVMDAVYDAFKERLLERTAALKVGSDDDCDLGPVVSERQLTFILEAVEQARSAGVRILAGGHRLTHGRLANGYYLAPTLLEEPADDVIAGREELFGPISALFRVSSFAEALDRADDTPYGLTAAVWTRSVDRGQVFVERAKAGMVVVNGPTYGSEPHMPFGGFKQSGNGFREAGTEALDVYSDWKTVSVLHDPAAAFASPR
ncbi:MAG: alpha-ketoglutaric semialdehyde dehydrogenase [Actinomycetota bacterium]|nr:alpha-ketoglutaric semialdehyde dehydrogenase [Actinomycetota bacterium]